MRAAFIQTAALLIASMSLLNSAGWGAAVSVPPQPKKTYTKATVNWPKLSATSAYAFAVACGKTANVCATVTPARLAPKFSWADPAAVLTVTAGTDPSCNGGQGGFLTVGGPATGCAPGQQAIAAKLNGKVVSTTQGAIFKFDGTLEPNDPFLGRSQDRYGIAETIKLGVMITPAGLTAADIGLLKWTISNGVGTLSAVADAGTASFDAGASPGSVEMKLEIQSGPAKGIFQSYNKTIVAPNGAYILRAPGTGISHTQFTASAGFLGKSFFLPKDVSFSNIETREDAAVGVGIGFYEFLNGKVHDLGTWVPLGACNITTGCTDFVDDTIQSGAFGPPLHPYQTGDFLWPIPWDYRVGTGPAVPIPGFSADHHQTADAAGKCCIAKAGAGPFCKNAADITSGY